MKLTPAVRAKCGPASRIAQMRAVSATSLLESFGVLQYDRFQSGRACENGTNVRRLAKPLHNHMHPSCSTFHLASVVSGRCSASPPDNSTSAIFTILHSLHVCMVSAGNMKALTAGVRIIFEEARRKQHLATLPTKKHEGMHEDMESVDAMTIMKGNMTVVIITFSVPQVMSS